MLLVFLDAFVVQVPFGMPDLMIAEIMPFCITGIESDGGHAGHGKRAAVAVKPTGSSPTSSSTTSIPHSWNFVAAHMVALS